MTLNFYSGMIDDIMSLFRQKATKPQKMMWWGQNQKIPVQAAPYIVYKFRLLPDLAWNANVSTLIREFYIEWSTKNNTTQTHCNDCDDGWVYGIVEKKGHIYKTSKRCGCIIKGD